MNRALKKYLAQGGSLGSLAKRPPKRPPTEAFPCEASDVFEKQVTSLIMRLRRIEVNKVVIGISGGLDSTLCLLVVVEAFSRMGLSFDGIYALTMPGFGTSKRTRGNAEILCESLGVKIERISIASATRRHLKAIGHDGTTSDVTYENAQARIRTLILMNKANLVGGIVLGTGDMSEIALGWCTYNGDHMSMFGVNAGVPKTIVRKVCLWWSERGCVSKRAAKTVQDIVATPVSPELVKNQVTEDAIGPYELHDWFIWNFIVNGLDRRDLLREAKIWFKCKYDEKVIKKTLDIFLWRLVSQAFKRNCQPDSIRVFDFDFSPSSWSIPSDIPKGIL